MRRVTMDRLEDLAFHYGVPMERQTGYWQVRLPGIRTYYAVIA